MYSLENWVMHYILYSDNNKIPKLLIHLKSLWEGTIDGIFICLSNFVVKKRRKVNEKQEQQ